MAPLRRTKCAGPGFPGLGRKYQTTTGRIHWRAPQWLAHDKHLSLLVGVPGARQGHASPALATSSQLQLQTQSQASSFNSMELLWAHCGLFQRVIHS